MPCPQALSQGSDGIFERSDSNFIHKSISSFHSNEMMNDSDDFDDFNDSGVFPKLEIM